MKRLFAAAAVMCACAPANATPWFTDATANLAPNPIAYATMDAVAHDIDADGDLDLVLPQEWRPNRILLNNGRAVFTLAANALPPPREDELVRPARIQQPLQKDTEDVSIADFNGDGLIDLIMVVEDDIQLGRHNVHEYYRAKGDGTYERIYGQLPDTIANAIAHADINGDGAPDIIISGAGQDRLLINNGAGNFRDETQARLPQEDVIAQDVEFFDADRDGDLDLYFAHVSWQERAPQDHLLINDGAGRFTNESAQRLPQEDWLGLDAEFADLDGDGDLDIVVGNGGDVRILANDGRAHFTDVTNEALPAPIPGVSISIEIADFNGDEKPDIYVGQLSEGARDRLLLNTRT